MSPPESRKRVSSTKALAGWPAPSRRFASRGSPTSPKLAGILRAASRVASGQLFTFRRLVVYLPVPQVLLESRDEARLFTEDAK